MKLRFQLITAALATFTLIGSWAHAAVIQKIEAESGTRTSPMQLKGELSATSGGFIQVPSVSTFRQATATLKVPLNQAARMYHMWVRVHGLDASSNEFYYSVNGGTLQARQFSANRTWVWLKVGSQQLNWSTHTFKIVAKEKLVSFDQILFTDDAKFIPVGKSPGFTPSAPSSSPTPTPTPTPAPAPTAPVSGEFSLRINPQFNRNQLTEQQRFWFDRIKGHINNMPVVNSYPGNPTKMAMTNDTFVLGRGLNPHIFSLMTTLRITGDREIVDEILRLSKLMRANLRDTNNDGFLNWIYNHDNNKTGEEDSSGYVGNDLHQMDDLLAHATAASMAYVLHVNRDVDSRYATEASFWRNYLVNHFEAKWRKRSGKATAFPYLTKPLTHAFAQGVRFYHYTGLLTGSAGYQNYAKLAAQQLFNNLRETPSPAGPSYVWPHSIFKDPAGYCQFMTYVPMSIYGMVDLRFEKYTLFNDTAMAKVANAFAHFVIIDTNTTNDLRNDICGFKSRAGLPVTLQGQPPSVDKFANPGHMLGRWDRSGRIQTIAPKIYNLTEQGLLNNPERIVLPAAMLLNYTK